ncbi:MAG TPA: VWA domain-containing protein [Bacillus bacterium]|nr:VWA domain-containing protein [Bacillus sp. (in: firmicutes)]
MMRKKFAVSLLIAILISFTSLSSLNVSYADNKAGLDYKLEPSSKSYLIDKKTDVATANLNASIFPKGVTGKLDPKRETPIDVVFIFDKSGSMQLDMKCYDQYKNQSKCMDTNKLKAAKDGAKNAIDKFKEAAIAGDRFAFVPFDASVGNVTNFNSNTSTTEVKKHLESMKTSIDKITANGGTNYYQAFLKANTMFGSSSKPKYIIFLTDGRPEGGSFSKIKISGEFSKKVNNTWSKEKYPVNGDVTLTVSGNQTVFTHKNVTYLYANYNNLSYSYAYAEAANLAAKDVKLMSIGFGSDGDVDMNFLNELSSLSGSYAQKGEKADISKIFENLTNKINKQALRNIKVKLKIKDSSFPGNVALQDGAVIDEQNPSYAVINFNDVQFEDNQTPTAPAPKLMSLSFEKEGTYNFNDVILTYVDLTGTTQTIKGNPFTISIVKNKNVGMKFNNEDGYDIDVSSLPAPMLDLYEKLEADPEVENSEVPKREDLTWSSEDESVAKVNSEGVVTPFSLGETQITVKATDSEGNEIQADTTVKVNLVVEKIELKKNNYLYTEKIDMFKEELVITPELSISFKLPREAILWGINVTEDKKVEWRITGNLFRFDNGKIIKQDKSQGGFEFVRAQLNPDYEFYKNPSGNNKAEALMKVNGNGGEKYQLKEQW